MAGGEPIRPPPPHQEGEEPFIAIQPPLSRSNITLSNSSLSKNGSLQPLLSAHNLEEGEINPSMNLSVNTTKLLYADVVKGIVPPSKGQLNRPGYLPKNIAATSLLFDADSITLKEISDYQGKPSVVFSLSEKQILVNKLKYVLVGKFSHGRPPLNSIRTFLFTLNLKGPCNTAFFDKKHIFIECVCKEDYYLIWLRLKWIIDGCVMRVFKWTTDFCPRKESSIAPVWIRVEGLPLYLFDEVSLLSISNAIGCPIKVDSRNVNRSMLHSARICIELDVCKPRLDEILITFKNEVTKNLVEKFWVKIFYDELPIFCSSCGHIGHGMDICKRTGKNLPQGKPATKEQVDHTYAAETETGGTCAVSDGYGSPDIAVQSIGSLRQNEALDCGDVTAADFVITGGAEEEKPAEVVGEVQVTSTFESDTALLMVTQQDVGFSAVNQVQKADDQPVVEHCYQEQVADKSSSGTIAADQVKEPPFTTTQMVPHLIEQEDVGEVSEGAGSETKLCELQGAKIPEQQQVDAVQQTGLQQLKSTEQGSIVLNVQTTEGDHVQSTEGAEQAQNTEDESLNSGQSYQEQVVEQSFVGVVEADQKQLAGDNANLQAPAEMIPAAAILVETDQQHKCGGISAADANNTTSGLVQAKSTVPATPVQSCLLPEVSTPGYWADIVEEEERHDKKLSTGDTTRFTPKAKLLTRRSVSPTSRVSEKIKTFRFLPIEYDFDPEIRFHKDATEKHTWSEIITGDFKLVARRSVSPVGRSSEKLKRMRRRVDFIEHDAGKTEMRDRKIYLKNNEEFYQAQAEYRRSLRHQHYHFHRDRGRDRGRGFGRGNGPGRFMGRGRRGRFRDRERTVIC